MADQLAPPHEGYVDDQRSHFDTLITRDWDTYHNRLWDAQREFEVRKLFDHVSPRTVMDVGCGCGFHDVLMAEQSGVELVEAIDYSVNSVKVAEAEYPHPRVRRRLGDIFDHPDGNFDLVVSFQVIEHIRDQQGFLAACARLTRPGGHVAVSTPNRLRLDNRLLMARGRPANLEDATHFRELSRKEMAELAISVGLRPRANFGYGLTCTIPRLNRQIVPQGSATRIGSWFPALANRQVIVLERP